MDIGIIVSTIGVFIQVIFDKYLSSKLEQWAVRANLGCEFQNLRRNLEMAQAILETLKGSTALGEGICQLAQELKASAYDAADVLDELDYFRLMDMVEDRSKEKYFCGIGYFGLVHGAKARPVALSPAAFSLSSRGPIYHRSRFPISFAARRHAVAHLHCGDSSGASPAHPCRRRAGSSSHVSPVSPPSAPSPALAAPPATGPVSRASSSAPAPSLAPSTPPATGPIYRAGSSAPAPSLVPSTPPARTLSPASALSPPLAVPPVDPTRPPGLNARRRPRPPRSRCCYSDAARPLCSDQIGALVLSPFKRARQDVDIVPSDWDTVSCKMKSIAESLQRTAANIERVAQLKNLAAFNFQQPQFPSSRQTSSLLTEQDFYGRDEEKRAIINMLLEPNRNRDSKHKRFSVLPVVGIGGVGKTTIVQHVYNDPTIMNSFAVRAWACVSGFLDVKQVTIDILQSIDEEANHQFISSRSLDNIQTMLVKKLKKRKVLIVLDDVWSCGNWELMCAPFKRGAHESKIIVTTRHHDIANSVGNFAPAITLRGLEDDPFWSLFKQKAFGDDNIFDNLALIGRKIANKLNGIPLAAKTIGKLLHKQLTSEHWTSILDSNLWELRQGPEDIMPALLLSYQHLPPNIQRCFAFCSAYQKDHYVSEEDLVYSWMAHGFIQTSRRDKTTEDIAREYFNELVSASFFEASANDNRYKMHGLLHDLACSVAQDECFITNNNLPSGVPNTVRHLYLLYPDQANIFFHNFALTEPTSLSHGELRKRRQSAGYVELKNLHSIWKVKVSYGRFINLRMLCLHHLNNEALLEPVGDLIHLRYLDLRFSDISELPESVCKLYHLQVLDVRSCMNLVKFPIGINNLISIRHLLLDDSIKRVLAGYAGIPYIGKLTTLQELDRFNTIKDEAFNIKQLKNLREMGQSLSIEHLENVANREEASQSGLKEKYRLNELNLVWSSNWEGRVVDAEINILEGLQPHPNLKLLSIKHYRGNIAPTWLANDLNIKYLESLYLQDCSGWEVLPPLGQLPYLKKLHFIGMKVILFIGPEFYGSGSLIGFPCLEELHFEEMPAWHSWYGIDEPCFFRNLLKLKIVDCSSLQLMPIEQWSGEVPHRWFPRLGTLYIQNCPNLDQLPPLPHASTLSRISLKNVGIISSMELNDEDIEICFISNLRLQKQYYLKFHNLRRLKSFSISSCDNFAVLPWKHEGERVIPEVSTTMNDIDISLSSINELKICGSGISEDILHEIFTNAGFLDGLSIKFCPQITSLELSPEIRLEYLVVEDCLQLRSLNCMQTLVRLRELNVLRSPKFVDGWKNLIQQTEGSHQGFFASLKRLHIDDSSFLAVPICRTLGYLQYLMIDSDQQIVSLTEDQEQAFCKLTSLQTLVFKECPNLHTLPARLHQISSLKRLDLLSCESIKSLPHQGLPGSLENLFIAGCSQLREKCIDGGTDQTKIAHVREIIL
ncbi:hypothetical protein BS78_03G041600 [Paspalum vaginatum]|nr:hypothetical protein BS78_03G041600 [Paspalum vaginatum]